MQPRKSEVVNQRISNLTHDVAFHEEACRFLAKQARKVSRHSDSNTALTGFLRLGALAKRAQRDANLARRELDKLVRIHGL